MPPMLSVTLPFTELMNFYSTEYLSYYKSYFAYVNPAIPI